MMEASMEYDLPEDFIPELPEKRCYTVEDLQNILMCGRNTVYDLLKKKEFRYFCQRRKVLTQKRRSKMTEIAGFLCAGFLTAGMA